jgi:hypothetical protein
MDVEVGHEEGAKEPEALEVVEVQVGEQHVDLVRQLALHRDTQRAHAGARVEHERMTAVEPDLDARGVPSVLDGVGAGRSD